jgi:hypothetical protein
VETTASAVLRRRLATQGLVTHRSNRATNVVRRLACVQSQEWAHAFWSLGRRTVGRTYAEVRAEFDAGSFLRTHILRPTWHFVAAEDLGWITEVTAPRVHQLNGTIYRQYRLDQRRRDAATAAIVEALAGGRYQTRAELGRLLGAEGVALAYLVMNAELEGVICSGPIRGAAQHTYALVSERVTAPARGDAVELARRFFVGHGPASVRDLARWASLTTSQAAEATEAAASQLASMTVDDEVLWLAAEDADRPLDRSPYGALLLPLYDELTLSYPRINFPLAERHPHPPGVDQFVGNVVVAEVNVGTWRRTVRGRKVMLEVALAEGSRSAYPEVAAAASEFARFLNKELELSVGP